MQDWIGRSGRALVREPWVRFLLLGAALLALHRLVAPRPPGRRIDVDGALVDGLRQEQRRRTGALPTADEERALVQRYVDSEVLYREALAQGLDRGDLIVRRRLVQKMEFLLEADADGREPSDEALRALLGDEAARFSRPARLTLEHVFVARDRHADARAEAEELRTRLAAGDEAARLGDPFLRGRRFAQVSARELAGVFGEPFADAVAALPDDRWSAPIESSFGLHLVRVSARTAARPATLDEVRAPLRQLWRERQRAALRRAGLERLRRRDEVRP
ncbi:MAG: peptidylprolyl isomerase [Polyangia bacterium]